MDWATEYIGHTCLFVLTDAQEKQIEHLGSERHIGWDIAHIQNI